MILRVYLGAGWTLAAVCCMIVSTSLGQPFRIKLNEDNEVDLKDTARKGPKEMDLILTDPSVRHFGRHALCNHQQGQKYFSDAVQTKMCNFTPSFVSNLVRQLCRRPKLLDEWVTELFDMDEDGRISYFERHQYSV